MGEDVPDAPAEPAEEDVPEFDAADPLKREEHPSGLDPVLPPVPPES